MGQKQPNILFLLSDEHNAKCLGHTSDGKVKTPHLDRLAAEGVRCANAVPQSPICTPSRVSFASGQYPHNHGYYGLAGRCDDGPDRMADLPHLFGHCQANGYRVGAVGKTHLPPDWIDASCDTYVEDKDPDRGYPAFLEREGIDLRRSASLDWGRRCKEADPPLFGHDGGPDELGYEHSVEHWEAEEAKAFLDQHRDEPFFLQVGFWRPHTPCTPSPEFWDLYPDPEALEPPNADSEFVRDVAPLREKREELEAIAPERFAFEPRDYVSMRRRYLRGYYGCVSQTDRAVGEILDHLDHLGLADNTIVVYSSDHGDFAVEHGLTEKAPGIWSDAVTRIPFIWRFPGQLPTGVTRDALIESVDLAPTVCRLAGLPPMATTDGLDIADCLASGAPTERRVAVTENPWSRAVFDGRYRLVHAVPELREAGVLTDVQADPWEMTNHFDDPEWREIRERLRRELLDWQIARTRVTTVHPSLARGGTVYGKDPGGRGHPVDADGKRGHDYIKEVRERNDRYL